MASPRVAPMTAFRSLARNSGSQCRPQARQLHMTGPATSPSPVRNQERSILNLPRDASGLRVECKRRKIDSSGSQQEMIARLNANEFSRSRAFSSLAARRPTPATSAEKSAKPVRHFNTSRAQKYVNDSSTIDFTFLPEAPSPKQADSFAEIRVPLLPSVSAAPSSIAAVVEPAVMKPQINTMSADAVYLPMSELSDGHAMNVDFHAMADRLSESLRRMTFPVEEQASVLKQVWSEMVDDAVRALVKQQHRLAV